jgi:hypothetical protein
VPDDIATAYYGDPADPAQWTGPWKTITNPTDIAKVVSQVNQRQYHQAHDTPFGSGPLAEAIGRNGDTSFATSVINEKIPAFQFKTIPETNRILDTIARPFPVIHKGSPIITSEEFTSSYKAIKESTSSSPSGHHVGHYKSAIGDPTLTELHSTMMSLPFQIGFAPDRWK